MNITEDDNDKLVQVLRHGWCTGYHCKGKNPAEDDHTCPFSEEIHGDSTSLCNCCEDCTYECAMDI